MAFSIESPELVGKGEQLEQLLNEFAPAIGDV
jgi:hypothetical protein